MDVDSLPISLVLHTAFCPRRTWLEVNGERSDASQLTHGAVAHKTVDVPEVSRPGRLVARDIRSEALGIHGRCDSLHVEDGIYRLVESKSTPVRKRPSVTEAQRLQLALQTICLAEEGISVMEQAVYFIDHRRTVDVEIDADEIDMAKDLVGRTRKIVDSTQAPDPLVDDSRCRACSHVSVCLPDEHLGKVVERRVHARNPDSQVVHLTTQGSRVSMRRGRLIVYEPSEEEHSIPVERVHSLVLHGNIDVSSAVIRELSWRNCTIIWCSSSGRVYSWSQPARLPNGHTRVRQHVISEAGHLGLAREFVSAKIANQATLLRRNGDDAVAVDRLRQLQRRALETSNLVELFGVEGEAASAYFQSFPTMLIKHALAKNNFSWGGRQGRGATDPINVLLNYCYGLLTSECIRALVTCGLDPNAGILHSSTRNKPAMALDLMEEFRQPIADSIVVSVINRSEISEKSFSRVTGSPRLTTDARKVLVRAFERRMLTEFKHPVFGYSVSWRRAVEVQARMALGVFEGSLADYKGVKIR